MFGLEELAHPSDAPRGGRGCCVKSGQATSNNLFEELLGTAQRTALLPFPFLHRPWYVLGHNRGFLRFWHFGFEG